MKRQLVMRFNLDGLPAPTVPPTSWEESRATYQRGPIVATPEEVVSYFKKFIGGKPKEAFLCVSCGIPYVTRHSDYIGDWIQVLKDHKRAIFTAAAKAQAAMDFVLKRERQEAVA